MCYGNSVHYYVIKLDFTELLLVVKFYFFLNPVTELQVSVCLSSDLVTTIR